VTSESPSQAESALDLVVVEALTCIELRETLLRFCEKIEAFDRLVDTGILGEIVQSVQDPLFGGHGLHLAILARSDVLENAP
jgi:hypothetical protein